MRVQPIKTSAAFLGYRIEIEACIGGSMNGPAATAFIFRQTGNVVEKCAFAELLDPVLLAIRDFSWPKDEEAAVRAIAERADHRARGAIALGRLLEANGRNFVVPQVPEYADRSDDYIRRLVLVALDDVARWTAGVRAFIGFDDLGICLMENIDPKRMEYVLDRLEGDGLIEQFADQSEPGNRPIKATSAGLRAADGLRGISQGPALLMEEAIALVERVVDRHAPPVTQRLREIAKGIYESRDLNHAQVGEIAQSLKLAIQDFLDIDAFWDGIEGERPRRDYTKERISALLKSKVDSETEQVLMPALGDYLFGWFGPLDAFVNKYRHPLFPELSSRFDAKRLLLYTYMLMADLIQVLRLS